MPRSYPAGRAVAPLSAAFEHLRKDLGDVGGLAVLDTVDVEVLPDRGAAVETLGPGLDHLEEVRPGGDDKDGIHPLDGHQPNEPRERSDARVAEDGLKLVDDLSHSDVLDREHSDRHPFKPVDVEHFHDLEQRLDLPPGAGGAPGGCARCPPARCSRSGRRAQEFAASGWRN